MPEDIFCARSKALCGIQPRCSGASTVSGTAVPLQGSPTLMSPCADTDLTGRSSWHGTKQMQLAAMLSVNSGITDFRYSLDKSYGYSQEIEGNDDFKDLREAAGL